MLRSHKILQLKTSKSSIRLRIDDFKSEKTMPPKYFEKFHVLHFLENFMMNSNLKTAFKQHKNLRFKLENSSNTLKVLKTDEWSALQL